MLFAQEMLSVEHHPCIIDPIAELITPVFDTHNRLIFFYNFPIVNAYRFHNYHTFHFSVHSRDPVPIADLNLE
jgi:hypothetical protein